MDVKKTIESIKIDVESITDPILRGIVNQLMNIVENQAKIIKELKEENQKLRDENNRLKGEKGKPTFRKQTKEKGKGSSDKDTTDISSEKERAGKKKSNRKKGSKKNKIIVNRTEFCGLGLEQLPSDARFKGYQSTIIQDIVIKTDNIEFKRQIYYSPSLKKTFIAPLPSGYQGEFGPNIKALIISLYHKSKMTTSAIVAFMKASQVLRTTHH